MRNKLCTKFYMSMVCINPCICNRRHRVVVCLEPPPEHKNSICPNKIDACNCATMTGRNRFCFASFILGHYLALRPIAQSAVTTTNHQRTSPTPNHTKPCDVFCLLSSIHECTSRLHKFPWHPRTNLQTKIYEELKITRHQ